MTRSRRAGAWDLRHGQGQRHRWSLGRMFGVGQHSTRTLVAGWSAIGLTFVLVLGTLFGYVKYRNVLDGIKHITVTDLGKRPQKFNNAMNLLLIGSDSRSGRNGAIGGRRGITGQRSDTVMIVHISPGHRHIYVLSFPRDTVVPIYPCAPEPGFNGQTAQPGNVEQLNSTFAFGGPGCLWKTLEHTTHIWIDDFIQLNFTGFISVINALGGVEVCNPTPIVPSRYDKLSLSAGKHFIFGREALDYWRLREDFGLGSDLQRIQRDQLLMVALVQRILSSGVLHSLTKTYTIVSDIVHAHALTTDAALSPTKIIEIGRSMAGISRKSVQFVEVPVINYPANQNWVEFDATQTPTLFNAVAHDVKLPKVHKGKKGKGGAAKGKGGAGGKGAGHKTGSSGGNAPKLLSTSKVSVEVLNGSGVQGIAGTTGNALTARGFHVLGSASAANFSYTQSVVQYASTADLAAARTVQAQLGKNVTLQLSSAVPAGTVNLILGSDFTALAPQQAQPPGNLAKQFNGYSGGTNVCKGYGTAFNGA